jgi:hypothetical protein
MTIISAWARIENTLAKGSNPSSSAKLKGMLPKLGKSAYDIAVKIITDIASETVKKIMGL